jgi:hypothetical protein
VHADSPCTQIRSLRFSGLPPEIAARILSRLFAQLAMLCEWQYALGCLAPAPGRGVPVHRHRSGDE